MCFLSPLALVIAKQECTISEKEGSGFSTEKDSFVVSSITSFEYNQVQKKFQPVRMRTLDYSDNLTRIEYVESAPDGRIIEKIISKHKDGLLTEMDSDLKGIKSNQQYSYNETGHVTQRTYTSKGKTSVEVYVYMEAKLMALKNMTILDGVEELQSIEEYDYNLSNNTYRKKRTSNGQTSFTDYLLNEQGDIIEKDDVYTQHSIHYQDGRVEKIISKDKEFKENSSTITCTYYPDGHLHKTKYNNQIMESESEYRYDKDGRLNSVLVKTKEGGAVQYSKYEFANDMQIEKMIHPPWYVNRELINRNLFVDVPNRIKEQDMNAALRDGNLSFHLPVYPESYTVYSSEDGENWQPKTKLVFAFKEL